MKKFTWLKVFNSPFKPPKIKFYFGKIAIGVPYFYPRKWVRIKDKPGYLKAVPLIIGFSYCDLGWKTKWSDDDFRFEWPPTLSFVFFKWQIACWVYHESNSHYWESWLYYELKTNKTKSTKERVIQCRKEFPNIWLVTNKGKKETINYYDSILKEKYK